MKLPVSSRAFWIRGGIAASGTAIMASLVISCSSQGMLEEGIDAETEEESAQVSDVSPDPDAESELDAVPEAVAAKPRRNVIASGKGTEITRSVETVGGGERITAGSSSDSGGSARSGRSAKPVEIPQQAFERNGATLNAYYFVRGEGSWVDLAQRIYRDPVRAEDLKAWNPKTRISTGSVVFYRSPTRPATDTAMKVFHEDFGIVAESYSKQKGDTLAKIAQARLGASASWVEIQAANPGLKSFSKLPAGTPIVIPPAEVNNAPILEQLAQAQLEGQRQNREQRAAEAAAAAEASTSTLSARSEPPPAPAQPSTTAEQNQRTPAGDESPVGRILAALQGLPVSPQTLGGALAIVIGGAFLLRRRTD